MADYRVNAGRLGHEKVTIEQPRFGGAGALGDMAENWTPIAKKVPADVNWLSGEKLLAARAVHEQASAEVLLRYNKKITARCRLIDSGGRELRIVGLLPDNLKRHMRLLCRSVEPSRTT